MGQGVVHCKRSPYDVLVDRTTKWGNPFILKEEKDRPAVLAQYEAWILGPDPRAVALRASLGELKGKVLACWCAPRLCHADVLYRLANSQEVRVQENKDFWIAFTGHRPGKYFGYDVNDRVRQAIRGNLYSWLKSSKEQLEGKVRICTLTGGALGFDQDALAVCEELGFYNKVCVPCQGQEARWPDVSKRIYVNLLQKASEIYYVDNGPYKGPFQLLNRNKYMVDNCVLLIALWDGKREKGGTAHCVGYAEETRNTPIMVIDPLTLNRSSLGEGWKFQTSLSF